MRITGKCRRCRVKDASLEVIFDTVFTFNNFMPLPLFKWREGTEIKVQLCSTCARQGFQAEQCYITLEKGNNHVA